MNDRSPIKQVGRLTATVAATLLLALGAGGCGDDGDSSATAPPAASEGKADDRAVAPEPTERQATEKDAPAGADRPPAEPPPSGTRQDSGGGVEQFVTPGGDNSVQEFGSEAGEAEFDEAAAALHAFLDAWAAGEWGAACDNLADEVVESLGQLASSSKSPELEGASCPQLLRALAGTRTAEARAEVAIADVGAMRVEGDRAFLLYRGAGKTPFAIPVTKEDDGWKVGALAGVPLA
jgi:hypothetical protein